MAVIEWVKVSYKRLVPTERYANETFECELGAKILPGENPNVEIKNLQAKVKNDVDEQIRALGLNR